MLDTVWQYLKNLNVELPCSPAIPLQFHPKEFEETTRWLKPVIVATWEAEIGRIMVQG
jgi:hypothetical protein